MKKVYLLAPFVLIATLAFVYVKWEKSRVKGQPNILLLSFCSLRLQDMPIFNEASKPFPALKEFFGQSLLFKNAVNGLPWSNITNYVDPTWLKSVGYKHAKRKSLRVPAAPINKNTPQNSEDHKFSFTDSDVRNYELSYREGIDKLKEKVLDPSSRPFFISAHFKYMHFPFIDSVNQKDVWRKEFTPPSAELLNLYLQNPARYPDKAPLLLTLFADPELAKASPYFKKYVPDEKLVRMGQLYQMLSDPGLLDVWRASENYAQDLKILHEAYALKLKNLDRELGPVLDLFGEDDLKQNTVVIFTGDHGESLMEQNHFLHSNNVQEDQIRFPLAVRPAGGGLSTPEFIDEQVDMSMMGKLIQLAVETDLSPAVVRDFASSGENIYLRNCQGSSEGLRFKSQFMLVNDMNGSRLFDLKRDPEQKTDVKTANREIYYKLRETLLGLSSIPRNLFACDHPLDTENPLKPLWRTKADPDI